MNRLAIWFSGSFILHVFSNPTMRGRNARGVRGGTTKNQVMSDGGPKGDFYRKQLLFSFKKRNKQSAYGIAAAGNKVKCDGGHTTVNVWI